MGDENVLPGDTNDLENLYGGHNYEDVKNDDAVRVEQCATDEFTIHLFKDQNSNSTDDIDVSWNGQTDWAPNESTVFLQIWNNNDGSWENLDSDNVTVVNQDFTLTGSIVANQSYYYLAGNWVACRVYQEAA